MNASAPAAQRQPVAILDTEKVQGSYYFRYDEFGAHSEAAPHSHRWGHLNYASHGSLSMDVPTGNILCPPQHGVWIPPRPWQTHNPPPPAATAGGGWQAWSPRCWS